VLDVQAKGEGAEVADGPGRQSGGAGKVEIMVGDDGNHGCDNGNKKAVLSQR